MAEAKLDDAECLEDVLGWLKPKERMAVLTDAVLLRRLLALPLKAGLDRAARDADLAAPQRARA